MIQPPLGHKSIAALAQFSISETAVADKKREGGCIPKVQCKCCHQLTAGHICTAAEHKYKLT